MKVSFSTSLRSAALCGAVLLCSCATQTTADRVRAITYLSQEQSKFVALSLFDLPQQPQIVGVQVGKDHQGEAKRSLSKSQFDRIWNDLEGSHLDAYRKSGPQKFNAKNNYAIAFGLMNTPPSDGPSLPAYVVPKNQAPESLKRAIRDIRALDPL